MVSLYGKDMGKKASILVILILISSSLMMIGPASSLENDPPWAQLAPMQVARSRLGVAEVNGRIYAIGGDAINQVGGCGEGLGFGQIVNVTEEYDQQTDTWRFKESMPTPRCGFAVAVFANKIYCVGGYLNNGSLTGANEAYNPALDKWETKKPMPTPRMYLQAQLAGGKIYFIGGNDTPYYGFSDKNEVYDPNSDSWTQEAKVPNQTTSAASALFDNKIYTLATASKLELPAFIQIYDVQKRSWSIGAKAPSYGGESQVAISTSQQIIFFDETSTSIYNPSNDSWVAGTSMPTPRGFAGVAMIAGNIHVIGGIKAPYGGHIVIASCLAAHEQYTPNERLPLNVSDFMIYIKADGSIEPSNSNIYTTDKVLYTFTGDILERRLVIERDNIVLNGNGYTLKGSGSYGIAIFKRNHVAVTNLTITEFAVAGIGVQNSTDITIIGNTITLSDYNDGIRLIAATNNTITRNSIEHNGFIGISLWEGSDNNTICENDIKYNWINILFSESKNNLIFHNNIVPNQFNNISPNQIVTYNQTNLWDNGSSAGGNYWLNNSYGSYVIDEKNRDNFPLMTPYYIASPTIDLSDWYKVYVESLSDAGKNLEPDLTNCPISAAINETTLFTLSLGAVAGAGLLVYFKKHKYKAA